MSDLKAPESLLLPGPILRRIAQLAPYHVAVNLRSTCKHNHQSILPIDLLESKFSTLYLKDPIYCWNIMTYYNKVLHLRRLAAIDPDLVPKALADGIHSDSIRHATSFNHIETVHYLLSLIPKPYQYWSPATGKAPLLIAAQEGYTEILALMVPYMDKPASALTWQAAKGGHLSAVQYFVNHYRTTEHLADVLNNGIYGAMSRNRLDIIEYLIENNLRNQPFMHSCMCDMIDWNLVDVYRLLVDHGFDVTAHQLRIAVHAQSGDDTEMLELVLDAEEWDREVLKEMAIESYSRGSIVQDLLNSYIKSEST